VTVVSDQQSLRHARERSVGFPVGQYLQAPPMLFSRDGHNLFLGDLYRGSAAFLVCSGPSLVSHDLGQLQQRGIVTLAVNNAGTVVRPTMWCCVDDPGNFSDVIWRDPGVNKFIPLCHMEKPFMVRGEEGSLQASREKVGDMPAVYGYRRNETFVPDQFLTEDTFNWGNHSNRVDALGNKGSRSVMYVAIRLLHYLGVRTIYLVGCDFKMENGRQNYAFAQDRSSSSVRGNNESYRIMNSRFEALLPYFAEAGLSVFNCTPESGLSVFPYKPFEEAIAEAKAQVPAVINTEGMYDRQAKLKERARKHPPEPAPLQNPKDYLVGLPQLTLVVPVNEGEADLLRRSWETWMRFKPWIAELPLVVLHHPAIDREELKEAIADHTNVRFEAMPVDVTDLHGWERAKVVEIPRRVEADWFWLLEPAAVATSRRDWLTPNLFALDKKSRPATLIACRWGYTKPGDTYERLNDWADDQPLFGGTSRLEWKPEKNADRVNHEAISSWSCLARREWAVRVAEVAEAGAPVTEHASFLLYCATRLGERVSRIPMKDHGWDHSFGWRADQVEARCREALKTA